MSHISDKAKTLAQATANLHAKAEKNFDDGLQKVSDISANIDAAMSKLDSIHADVQSGANELSEAAKNLTNE